ncbi:MAG: flagellar biosynthesis protein FliQ [Gammaproteobacteria bacterium]|nr:flagellar biosynthesis protein FliQ [Gammaproteobacteria bacterium]
MTADTVITLGQYALITMLMIAAPPLLTALTVGLFIGVFQAATQVNELTLSFIPKMISLVLVLIAAGPWILKVITSYTERLYREIPFLIG